MPVIAADQLATLQRNSNDVRNICILAHVDHGKTSLSDALIATNGIISPKMVGKVRYLDSRPDEQLRGITMESSAISLSFSMARRSSPNSELESKDYLINLIDSPGHVDFSSEVSTASRLCDGALVLVDAVEGVCSQTVTVLRQVWIERMKPLLVINKIDRLVWELKMSASEAYSHLSRLVEEINAVLGSFFQGERMEEDLHWREKMEQRLSVSSGMEDDKIAAASTGHADSGHDEYELKFRDSFVEKDDESIYFAPENNNIIFSSAIDGWAFTIRQFASMYEKKLGIKRSALEKVLWGDFYLDPKTKRVLGSKHLKGRPLKPMFVQLVLDNIWAVYDATTGGAKARGDSLLLEKIIKSLSINIPPHIIRSKDSRALLAAIFSSWLPLSTAVLVSVVEHIPSPPQAQVERLPALIDSSPGAIFVSEEVRKSMSNFTTSSNSTAIAYVSKMVSFAAEDLPENKRKHGSSLSPEEARELARLKRAELTKLGTTGDPEGLYLSSIAKASSSTPTTGDGDTSSSWAIEKEPDQLIGFARLYSGMLSVGDFVYVLPPKFSPENPYLEPIPQRVPITALYMLMGRSLEPLNSVPAGVVFGIGGLGGHILKTGTISTRLEGSPNLAGIVMGGEPIVRVALEPTNPKHLGKMIQGMKLLERSDPCAQYEVLESGEHVILTAGELHLERCLKDLRERYARCDIQVGEPIVPFRESIVHAAEMGPPKNQDYPRGTAAEASKTQQLSIRVRVRPLPGLIIEFLTKHSGTVRQLHSMRKAKGKYGGDSLHDGDEAIETDDLVHPEAFQQQELSPCDFENALRDLSDGLSEDVETWKQAVGRIMAFGPRRIGPSILVDSTEEGIGQRFLQEVDQAATISDPNGMQVLSDLGDRISHAFQLATAQGPLCHEPMHGICVFLEDVSLGAGDFHSDEGVAHQDTGRLTGEIIRIMREAIREGFLDWSPRLMMAMYSCEIQAPAEVLGRVYGVITRRRGRILSEALNEGTPFFTITAVLPVAESFGFSDEIRKRTSGGASPQLRFQGFELLDQDPFWVPFTEDELEDLGELADRENLAKRYMDSVRRRKGLLVKSTRTTDGEKARTLKK